MPSVATGTITNDDSETLTISSPTVTEGNAGTVNMVFTVTSSERAVQGGFTVAFTMADVTTNATDHAAFPSGLLTFAGTAGETQTITVVVNGDTTIEANETLTVTLGTVTAVTATQSAAITTGAVGTGTITNDDSETLTITSPTVTEGNAGTMNMIFTVTSPSAVQGGFTVAFTMADVTTNATDHAAFPSGLLTFAGTAGETQTITVVINGDTTIEANETLTVTLGTVTAPRRRSPRPSSPARWAPARSPTTTAKRSRSRSPSIAEGPERARRR